MAMKLMLYLKIKHCSVADRGAESFKRKAKIVKKTVLDSLDLTSKKYCCH
jgi:hypothetical protein